MNPARILLVEDNPLNAELVQVVLGRAGMEVQLATAGEAAVAALAALVPQAGSDEPWPGGPDVVLIDIQLPDIDGVEVARRMRLQPAGDALCLVAFTAFAMVGDKARLLASGFDGYLEKPIDVATFADRVSAFVHAPGAGHAKVS